MQNSQLKVSIVVQDTWAIWRTDDLRGLRATEFDNTLLPDWYGCDSQKWNELLQNKNSDLKPWIMFVGENPSKNNKKILDGENLIIQCFHSSSPQDLLIKQLMENSYFQGSYMTDAFDSAFEENGKKITLSDIKKKYPAEWQKIFSKARERFEQLLAFLDRRIIIAFGGEAFKYIQQFTKGTFQASEISALENGIKSLTLSRDNREWQVFKIYHPSPETRPKYHRQIQLQVKSLEKIISTLMNIKQIIDYLNKYKAEIIKKLSTDDWRHFRYYCRIKESFLNNNLDIKFKKFKNDFCYFYAMNGPAGLNDSQKNEFLKLLSAKEKDLEKILRILYEIPSNKGTHKLFLSFGTKLLHTIDKNLPIYDSYIAYVIKLKNQVAGTFEVKIKNRIDIYNELKNNFEMLLADSEINVYLRGIRKEIAKATEISDFEWKDDLVSDTKLLDSSLWALYDSIKKIEE